MGVVTVVVMRVELEISVNPTVKVTLAIICSSCGDGGGGDDDGW